MESRKMISLDRAVASSPVVILWGKPEKNHPVEFISGNISRFGYTADEIVLGSVPFLSLLACEERRSFQEKFLAAAASGPDFLVSGYRIVTKSGEVRWIEDQTIFHRDGKGKASAYQSALLDVTGRREIERKAAAHNTRLEHLHSMYLAFMEELDFRTLLLQIVKKAAELAGTEHASLSLYRPNEKEFLRIFGTGLYSSMVDEIRPAETGISGIVLREQKRVVIQDYGKYPGKIADSRMDAITTIISMPFFQGKKFMGVLSISYVDGYPDTDEELLSTLDHFAAAVSIALENARLYEDSRKELEERKKAEELLFLHEKLAEAAAEGASFLLSGDDAGTAMVRALRTLGAAVGALKSVFYRNMPAGNGAAAAEKIAEAFPGEERECRLPARFIWEEDFPGFFDVLSSGTCYQGGLPHEGQDPGPGHSLHVTAVPVIISSRFWGFLAFCFLREKRNLNSDELDVLRAAAYNLAASVSRWESDQEVKKSYSKLRKTFIDVIRTMGQIVGKKDPYTIEHQERVALLAYEIGAEMGLDGERLEGIRIAGLVHDVGKVEIPEEILSKPGRLSRLEYDLVKTHAQSGYDILREVEFPWPVAEITYQHHERLDGSGYPRGLKGGEILPETLILMVADVVEAMASHRPYRPALGVEAAIQELEDKRGILYGPEAVDACIAVLRKNPDFFSASV